MTKYLLKVLSSIIFLLILYTNIAIAAYSEAQSETQLTPPTQHVNDYFDVLNKTGILRWSASSMPLRVFIRSGDTTDGFRPVFITLLEQAFSDWATGSNNLVHFSLINDPSKADIVCVWTSDKNDMTKLTEGGHALVVPEGHNIRHVQISILTKTIKGGNLTDQFMKRVALHEVGHTLGITDHSPDPSDMMFGCPPSTTNCCTLTDRDKNTLIALYTLSQSAVDHSNLNLSTMLPAKNNQSNLARIIRLNAEASKAMETKNLAVAVAKLEEAHQIAPDNDLINSNLGAVYGNCAVVSCLIKDNQRAQTYFNKALPLLAKGPNTTNYLSVLRCYENFLRANNKVIDADKIAKKIKLLSP